MKSVLVGTVLGALSLVATGAASAHRGEVVRAPRLIPATLRDTWSIQTGPTSVLAAGQTASAEVGCPKKRVVMGGGVRFSSSAVKIELNESSGFGFPPSWRTFATNGSRAATDWQAVAVCMKSPRSRSTVDGTMNAPPGQSLSTLPCPAGMLPVAGGMTYRGDTSLSLASSNPNGSSWDVWVNNASSATLPYEEWVLCAGKVKGYRVVDSGLQPNPAHSQSEATATCPIGQLPLGGGVYSTSSDIRANMGSYYPTATGYVGSINNATSTNESLVVYAVCWG